MRGAVEVAQEARDAARAVDRGGAAQHEAQLAPGSWSLEALPAEPSRVWPRAATPVVAVLVALGGAV
jgi:hypothetical protein